MQLSGGIFCRRDWGEELLLALVGGAWGAGDTHAALHGKASHSKALPGIKTSAVLLLRKPGLEE